MIKARIKPRDGHKQPINVFGITKENINLLEKGHWIYIDDENFVERPFVIMYGKNKNEVIEQIEMLASLTNEQRKKALTKKGES